MTELARQLATQDNKVWYVTETDLSEERKRLGWSAGNLDGVRVHQIVDGSSIRNVLDSLPLDAVHLTQGVRANGLISRAQKEIAGKGLIHIPILEKVDLRGFTRVLKSIVYSIKFRVMADQLACILAIGSGTKEWIEARAPSSVEVLPFAYFLKAATKHQSKLSDLRFKFIFVGSLIRRKRVDLLLIALSNLRHFDFTIEVVGDGEERECLERLTQDLAIGDRVQFTGTVEMKASIDRISYADCLILPSDHDGWGAVASEALLNGTPVICSSECGVSSVVSASQFGGVFEAGNSSDLQRLLEAQLLSGKPDARTREVIAEWGSSLNAKSGAKYLAAIIKFLLENSARPNVPWEIVQE